MSLIGILMLLLTAVTGQDIPSFTVRAGDDMTLPCGKVNKNQQNCDQISWLYSHHLGGTTEKLVTHGNINKNEVAKAERLNVAADCSLVIESVTPDDVGLYNCRQFRSGEQHDPDDYVFLSVINMESHSAIFFICSVVTYSGCWHSVQWLYEGRMKDTETSRRACSANVTLTSPHPDQKSNLDESLYCKVTDHKSGQTLLPNVRHQSSQEETEGKERIKETTPTTPVSFTGWLRFIIVCVLLAALILIVVAVNIWTWTRKNKLQTDQNALQNDEDEDDGSVVYETSGRHDASIGNQ